MSKYGNRRVKLDGHTFDSVREAARYRELSLLVKAGAINDLELQKSYLITVNGKLVCRYVADFVYQSDDGLIVEDVKGFRTPVYKLKKKLMLAAFGIEIREVE